MSNSVVDQTSGARDVIGNYVMVNGLNMYYEIHSAEQPVSTTPLVLIHGAFSATGTSFGTVLPGLAKTRQVISVEQQGHGHTADIERPIRTKYMAEDTVALLRKIGIEKADIFGYSMGANVALEIAIRHPEIVRKLVFASLSYHTDGLHPEMLVGMDGLQPEMLHGSPFHEEYLSLAPRPEDFPKLVERVKEFNGKIENYTDEQVKSVQSPAMFIIGDSDIIQPEHAVKMFRMFGGGVVGDNVGLPASRLAILPGTTHVTVAYRGEWLAPMINEFLDA